MLNRVQRQSMHDAESHCEAGPIAGDRMETLACFDVTNCMLRCLNKSVEWKSHRQDWPRGNPIPNVSKCTCYLSIKNRVISSVLPHVTYTPTGFFPDSEFPTSSCKCKGVIQPDGTAYVAVSLISLFDILQSCNILKMREEF